MSERFYVGADERIAEGKHWHCDHCHGYYADPRRHPKHDARSLHTGWWCGSPDHNPWEPKP